MTYLFLSLLISSASYASMEEFHLAAKSGEVSSLKKILTQENLDVNVRNGDGYTALIYAAYYGHQNAVEYLLTQKADPCIGDKRGNTALMGALFKGNFKVAYRLIKTECAVDQENNSGQTALMYASLFNRNKEAKALLQKGASAAKKDYSGRSSEDIAEGQGHKEIVKLLKK